MDDLTQKWLVGVAVPVTLALVFWVNRTLGPPLWRFLLGLSGLVSDVQFIKAELQSNGGRSLKDHVAEISNAVTVLDARQQGLIAGLPRPMFETDCHFNWTHGNLAMERLTGLGFAHLKRKRWVSMIHEEDRAEVMAEIDYAVKDNRGASVSFRFVTDEGIVPVKMEAHPIFNRLKQDQVICWSGTMTKLDDRRVEERRTL